MQWIFKKEIIEEYISANKLTKKEFCKQCGISISTFYRIMNGKDYYVISLYRIAKKLNMRLNDFFY